MSVERQAEEVDRVKRSESGMIVDPITIEPGSSPSPTRRQLMQRYRISGVPVTKDGKLVGILTNRDLRFETRFDLPISRGDDQGEPDHRSGGHHARTGRSHPAPASRGKAAGGGRPVQPQGPDHRQGHPEEAEIPQLRQGRAGPPARGRGHRRHRRFPGARAGTGGAQGGRAGHRYRPRPQQPRDGGRQDHQEQAARTCS